MTAPAPDQRLLIHNIGQLVSGPLGPVSRLGTPLLTRHVNAALSIRDGRIEWMADDFHGPLPAEAQLLDAGGNCVIPGLIDCHTHAVFAGTRVGEFVQRIQGRTYAQIAESGGGIRVTVAAVRRASEDELIELALPRLQRMLAWGVTTLEIKSGYGLNPADELKMLRVIRRLGEIQPVEVVGTYLAAHTVPHEYAGRADAYLDAVLDPRVLQAIADEHLAEFADVFCEQGAFDLIQARRVLTTCARFGLRPRVHADQITQMGATRLAAEVGAISADHLETIDDAGLDVLHRAGVVAVLLPACSFFLGVPQAPARQIIAAGIPVAVATDFNPGSCPVESLPLALSVACTQMRLTPQEALVAATTNAAAVLGRSDRLGSLAPGRQADLLILDVPEPEMMLYYAGRNCVRTVIKNGAVVLDRAGPTAP